MILNTTQLEKWKEHTRKLREQVKANMNFKYNIGDVLEGEVNVFFVTEQIMAERVVDVEEEIRPGCGAFVNQKDWAWVPEYRVECPTLNRNFQYNEKQLDKMLEDGHTLHRKKQNENKD